MYYSVCERSFVSKDTALAPMPVTKCPKKNKQILLSPTIDKLKPLIESNQKLLNQLKIDGIPFLELRRKLYSSIFNELNDKPIVFTGHQPIIYHPGILFKEMVVNALIKRHGFRGLNLVVDTDSLGNNQSISIPSLNGCQEVQLFPSRKHLTLEEIPPPSREEFDQQWHYLQSQLKDALPAENLQTFNHYLASANKALPVSKNLAQFNTFSRRIFAQQLDFNHIDVFLSSLCQTEAFIYFFSLILSRAEEFALCYNIALDRHRRQRGIKHPLTPFPNLRLSTGIIELPFWVWEPGQERSTLYLRLNGHKADLLSGNKVILSLPPSYLGVEPLVEVLSQLLPSNYKLGPKALLLTLFARLFLCHLWIHGVGGAEYEGLNDRLAEDFFSITLPPYAVASASLYLNFGGTEITDRGIRYLKDRLRRMRSSPERFLSVIEPLIKAKEELIQKIAQDKQKELYSQLVIINDQLRAKIMPQIQDLERETIEKQRLLYLTTKRDFPFFIYPLADLESLSTAL